MVNCCHALSNVFFEVNEYMVDFMLVFLRGLLTPSIRTNTAGSPDAVNTYQHCGVS